MRVIAFLLSFVLILVPLMDGFETILQPRRVTHRYRFARLFYRWTWLGWRRLAGLLPAGKKREAFLSVFGPASLLWLFATWMAGLVVGFALLYWSLQTELPVHASFGTYVYLSGCTFYTLGFGDTLPPGGIGRALGVIEAGLGFGFLAVIVSYLPVLSQAFSRREATISLLDARAGSPPSALEFLLRLARFGRMDQADVFLREWEIWAAELLESHLSFPVLSFYRSQHENQSWLAALTMILDTCSLLMALGRQNTYRAQLTYAMARHAAVDLCLVLSVRPVPSGPDRLPAEERRRVSETLRKAGVEVHEDTDVEAKLGELRAAYEPFVGALAVRLLLAVPAIAPAPSADNWQRSGWMRRTPGIGSLPGAGATQEDHF